MGNKGEYNLISISLTEKKMTKRVPVDINSIDGITKYRNGYIVSWMSKIMMVDHQGISQLLLDTQSNNLPNADFEFLSKENIIVVPMLNANKVIAYKIVDK